MNKKTFTLNESAFSTKDMAHFFLTSANQDSRQKLLEAIGGGCKLLTLTGESGVGKSLLVENFITELGSEVELINIQSADLKSDDLFDFIAYQYGLDLSAIQDLSVKTSTLAAQLAAQSVRHFIIQFDQAQLFTEQELGQRIDCLQALSSELQQHGSVTIQFLLLGLPALEMQVMESLLWRFDPNEVCLCRMKPLSADEVCDYIKSRLESNESRITALFSELAVQRVISYSSGILRQINKLCDLGLMTAGLNGKHTVTAVMIDEVAENCMIVSDTTSRSDEQQENSRILHTETLAADGQSADDLPDPPVIYKPVSAKLQHYTTEEQQSASSELLAKNESDPPLKRFVFLAAFIGALLGAMILIPAQQEKSLQPALRENNGSKQYEKPLQKEVVEATPHTPVASDMSLITESRATQSVGTELQKHQLKTLDDLFKLAERQLAKKQLLTPREDSAWQTYQKVLSMAPQNQKALAGIENIKTTYIVWARHEIKKKNYPHAEFLFRKALEISPGDVDIMSTLIWLELEQEGAKGHDEPDQ